MKRDLAQLANNKYDLLVIGGGIHGACVAWDAVLRGLSVALVEKEDFGHATSANSLKIIHGGLRYVQDANLERMRTMIREQRMWLRIAPHLVHPLPCLMPTYKKLTRSRIALAAALMIKRLVGYGQNRFIGPQKQLPNGRIISKSECLYLLPGLAAEDNITGGAFWYEAQMYNSERLLLSIVLAAAQAGATIANYVKVTGFLGDERNVTGVTAKDVLTDQTLDIRARMVVNSAGAWVDALLARLNGHLSVSKFHLSTAINLVTRQIMPEYAVGVPSQCVDKNGGQRSRMLFITPWRHYSLIGTRHAPYSGAPQDYKVTEEVIRDFIEEINAAYPEAALKREDVYHIHQGFLPMIAPNGQTETVKLMREGQCYDHEQEEGLAGLITVIGVKYSTAREVAQKAVDLAVKKLGRKVHPCQTHQTPVYGGQIDQFDDFLAQTIKKRPYRLNSQIIQHLVYSYGTEYRQILRYLDEEPAWAQTITAASPVIKAEVIHAIREEMAQKLTDVIRGRTELGAAGLPDEACLGVCAEIMAAELGWSQVRREQEIDEARATYAVTAAPQEEKLRAS